MATKQRKGAPDYILVVLTLALVVFGLIMVFSSSAPRASYNFNNPVYFAIKQLAWAFIGFGLLLFFSAMKYPQLQKGFKLYFIVSFLMLLAVLVIGGRVNGSKSWLSIGPFGIQPSEFAKLATIIYLSSLISKKGEGFRDFRRGFMPAAAIVGVFAFLILLQPDIGSASIFVVSATSVIFAGGTRWKIVGSLAGIGATIAALGAVFVAITGGVSKFGYLKARLGMDPWSDPLNTGYHLVNSLYAIGHGSFFGVGLGNSIQKLLYLPESHNDFIFPIIAEELGFVGVAIYLTVFVAFLWRGMVIALKSKDTFGMLAGTGIVCMIAFQAFVNIGGVTNTIPLTGVTLPFISYGGSSLWVLLMSVGVLLNISRQPDHGLQQTKQQ